MVGKTDTAIRKNKTGFIKAKFDTRRRRGKQSKSITVLTNDPKNSKIVLTLVGEISARDSKDIKKPEKKAQTIRQKKG